VRSLARDLIGNLHPRWEHVQAVGRAMEVLVDDPSHDLPEDLVYAAWLHDVGYAAALEVTLCHAIDGAIFLQALGLPPDVVSLVAWHTGAAWEASVRDVSDDLEAFTPPPDGLLDVLNFVDLTTGPDGATTEVDTRISEILERYDVEHPVHRSVTNSAAALRTSAARARARLVSR